MTGKRNDPFAGFQFYVEIQGIAQAVFSECSGLRVETEVLEYQEGGVNDYVHKLPGRTKVGNLSLKRGITDSTELRDWYLKVLQGRIERQSVSVVLYDQEGNEKLRWTFVDAYPVKWEGPPFKADDAVAAIETLELAHRGLNLA